MSLWYFLDDNLNEVLSYEFKFSKLTTDKLFLSFITSKKYGVGKAPIIIHQFKILEDGHVFQKEWTMSLILLIVMRLL